MYNIWNTSVVDRPSDMCIVVTMFNLLQLDSCHTCHMISSFDCLEIIALTPQWCEGNLGPCTLLECFRETSSYEIIPFYSFSLIYRTNVTNGLLLVDCLTPFFTRAIDIVWNQFVLKLINTPTINYFESIFMMNLILNASIR